MEFHQRGKWTITQLPEGLWQLEEQISHEDQIGAAILSSNLSNVDLLDLQAAIQSAMSYEFCDKCGLPHPLSQHSPLYEKWVRSLADYDNLLKRNKTDLQQAQFDVSKRILSELLILVDNIEAILKVVATRLDVAPETGAEYLRITPEEARILRSSLESVLSKNEVSVMFPEMKALSTYDPDKHQAIEMINGEVEQTQIVPLIQGYVWRDKVLRTAQVRIVQPTPKHDAS